MCGIAGALSLAGGAPDPALVARMSATLAHRGPDGDGLVDLGPAVLAHRRLAVLDLSERGAQPMTLDDAGLTLVHNGEVYNWLELRAELEQAGARFRSDTDTEVVLRAYERWGLDAFERLRGMWALALWDAPRRRLVLSRDRFGVKPLYVHEARGALVFASELKAIVTACPDARAVDEGVLGRFLLTGLQDEGERTFFAPVRQLAPGAVLALEAPGARREERRLWRFSRERARASFDYGDPAATLRGLLEEAVGLHLRSDVPVGTCLSGGLDSSTVVALAARAAGRPMHTFTAVHDDAGMDERRHAREVAARFGCVAHEVRPDPGRDLVPLLDRIGWFHDEPCGRPGLVTQWHVMQAARGHVTVLLDGQGGDETLLGYSAYALPYLRSLGREALRHPARDALALKLVRDGVGLLRAPTTTPDGPGTLLRHLVRAGARRLRRRRAPALSPALVAAAATLEAPHEPLPPGTPAIDGLLLDDLTHGSIPALLHHEDRASMAFSLEARVPLLDHRLVEFCLGIDFREKVAGGHMKAVLRRAVADLLPPAVVRREDKLGYPTPIGRWLREAAADVKEALLVDWAERGHVPAAEVERAWLAFERKGRDPWLLYRWLTTELWLQRFVDRPPAPPSPAPPSPAPGV
ncbi:MAG: asparagine synthase (glutamine-hydrolyzing) [Planctomycetes bacterium]|nr:asparagine synthase (glutamine-hydrolyzing) [Planctomycetota bacterium]